MMMTSSMPTARMPVSETSRATLLRLRWFRNRIESSRVGEMMIASTMTMNSPKRLWNRKTLLTAWLARGPSTSLPTERRIRWAIPGRAGDVRVETVDRDARCWRNRMPDAKHAIQKPTPVYCMSNRGV